MSSHPFQARILAVDDDPGVLHAVKRILGSQFTLAVTTSPVEALDVVGDFRPDLAILDIRMPALDGFELMQRLRERLPDLDVIFVTGSVTDPDAHLVQAIQHGAFYFVQKPFDRQVLQILVERCLELRQLRSMAERELTLLRVAQSRLLPQVAPLHADYEIAFRYRPFYFATGDYHGFFPQPDGSLAVFIGDSCGHGPSACMLMATMRTLLSTHPEIHGESGVALGALTGMFHRLIPSDLFMTAVYLRLGPAGRVDWAAAGQHPPLLLTRSGVAPTDQRLAGLPLGIEPEERYQTVRLRMEPGDRLLVFTDGIVEATNRQGQFFGVAGIKKASADAGSSEVDAGAFLDRLVEQVKEHLEGSDFADDFTVLTVERRKG
jgi:phosphoserine phosphatase RsbU/P